MGRLKNIRLNKLFSLCLVSCLAFNSVMISAYADSDSYVNSDSETTIDNISDINNVDNLGNTYTVNAKTICVYDEYILVNDGTGEMWVFLDGITVNNIQNEDNIFVKGTLIQVNDKILISVNDANDIGLIVESEEPKDDVTIPDNSETPAEGEDTTNKPENNTGSSTEDITKPSDSSSDSSGSSGNSKPGSSASSNSSSTSKPSSSSGNSSGTSDKSSSMSNSSNDVYTGPIIKANAEIEISYELTSSQWEEVKAAYESGYIKIKDLTNNKLRITKVSKEYGDTIWIVNDPRMLDTVENKIFIIGSSILESIDYNNYDISESSWNSIHNDVSNGLAKIKLLENDVLEVVYPSESANDSTIKINKK